MRVVVWRAVVSLLPLVAAAQSPVLEIRVLSGEATRFPLGSRAAKFVVVKVTDELGKPVAGALVSFRLPEDGPSGLFSNQLRTDVVSTAEDGTALAPPVRWNRLPGAFELRVVAVTEQSRAGTVVPLYLSEEERRADGGESGKPTNHVQFQSRGRYRWLVVGLVAAGAAGVGFSTGWIRRPRQETPQGPEPPRVGSPVISIGRP